MNARILTLACSQLVLGVAGLWAVSRQDLAIAIPDVYLFVGFAVVLSLLSLLPRIYIEHDRHGSWITPSDSALLIGLFALGPYGFVAASLAAELVITVRFRQSPLKTLFNLTTMFGGAVAAAVTFAMVGRWDPLDPVAWLGALFALAAMTAWDALASAAVLAVSEKQPMGAFLARLAPAATISLLLSGALGIVALILYEETGPGVMLFVPVLGLLVMSARAVSQQRAERHRLQQLYEASSGLAELASLPEVLGRVATAARTLVIGSASLCCTVRDDGSWTGMLVDDDGAREAPDAMVSAIVTLAAGSERAEMAVGEVDRQARRALPPFSSVVWSVRQAEPAGRVVLAVLRELPTDEQREHRTGLLAAFVAHAASVVANSQLHGDVRRALERQMELNEQKSDFVASVSHELRTPLASMIAAVQTIRRLGDERMSADERRELLDLGLSQGTRLQRLIEDLLLVAATDHQDVTILPERVDLAGLLAEIAAEMRPRLGERLVLDVDPGIGELSTDVEKLRRILLNLLENASKYAPEGRIELQTVRTGSHVGVAVTDQGPGIPVDQRERVFERFVQLDQSSTRRQGGTGLGLHLSRELAGLLGGRLELEGASSGGARFVLWLPVCHDAGASASHGRGAQGGVLRSPTSRPRGVRRPPAAATVPAAAGVPAPPVASQP